ncbi:MAG: prepilin-type N-terminal cleavage/methylation domain-containing protein [Sedimentisphaerales bacterium]|nr:prepilin-type N-terminal cleavage/methylation domain-containing protein [Sedimentisphaerales bacterium]
MPKICKKQKGFTIIEALVGALLLAIGAVVACGISQHCSKNWLRCQQYETAYQILDECFEQALLQGPASLMKQELALQRNVVRPCAEYHCEYRIEPTAESNLYEVAVTINWLSQNGVHEVTSTTLIFDPQQPGEFLEY